MNNILNYFGSQLNLVFTSDSSIIIDPSNDSVVPIDRYHPPFNIKSIAKNMIPKDHSESWFYNFKNRFFKNE